MKSQRLSEEERGAFVRMAELLAMGEACQLRRRLLAGLWDAVSAQGATFAWPGPESLVALGRSEVRAALRVLPRRRAQDLKRELGVGRKPAGWFRRERMSRAEADGLSACLSAPVHAELPGLLRAGLHRVLRLEAPEGPEDRGAWLDLAPRPYRAFLRLADSLACAGSEQGAFS